MDNYKIAVLMSAYNTGKYVHQAVLNSKDEFTGVTVHYINNEYDKGDIIHQEKVKVINSDSVDSLASRVLKVEHKIYSQIVQMLCEKINCN